MINVAKIHVCEKQHLDPRRVMLFRDHEVLRSIMRWAEKGFKGMPPQSFDPTKSFHDNRIKEEEGFWVVDDLSSYALCPICMERRRPELLLGFDCVTMRFRCQDCGWHWEVTVFENSRILIEDEMVYVILHARFGTIHRRVPSNMKVSQVVEALVRQACGIRGEVNGRVVLPDEIRVFDGKRELRNDLSLSEQEEHYSVSLDTRFRQIQGEKS